MRSSLRLAWSTVFSLYAGLFTDVHAALVVSPSTDPEVLAAALGGANLTIGSVSLVAGKPAQVGVYSGFGGSPVKFDDGVLLSTGPVANSLRSTASADSSADDMGQGSTVEFDNYARRKLPRFQNASDVAALRVDFSLIQPSIVSFRSLFGSVEFSPSRNVSTPYSDSFFTFLDGDSEQISYARNGEVLSVNAPGLKSTVTMADTNAAFGAPHGLLKPVTTTTTVLAAGQHSLLFEIGDINDWSLNSAVFLSGLTATPQAGRPNQAALPSALPLLGFAVAGLLSIGRRKN